MRDLAGAARNELNRMIQLKAEALATRTITLRDDRYVLQVGAPPTSDSARHPGILIGRAPCAVGVHAPLGRC